jgi:hypothetical protein
VLAPEARLESPLPESSRPSLSMIVTLSALRPLTLPETRWVIAAMLTPLSR